MALTCAFPSCLMLNILLVVIVRFAHEAMMTGLLPPNFPSATTGEDRRSSPPE